MDAVGAELRKQAELPAKLEEVLPCNYSYKLKKWTPSQTTPHHFEAVILTNVYTEEEAQEWWREFNRKSNTTMRVRATCPKTGKVNTFKIYLRCLHQGRAEKTENESRATASVPPVKKNTHCPAGMVVAIRRHVRYSRSKMRDPVDPLHPCEIEIRFIHNHTTDAVDSRRFRPVSREVEGKLLQLYQMGHSPSSAFEMLKIDLQFEHAHLYSGMVSDRHYCPDKSFCYRQYYKHFRKDYAAAPKKSIVDLLNDKVFHYNKVLGESCLSFGASETDYAVAVCSPLMRRAHTLPQSADVVHVEAWESPGNKERPDHFVFVFFAHTVAGGIPLGAILCNSNSETCLTLGFELLKRLLGECAFFYTSVSGPFTFLTEEAEACRAAIHSVWPGSDVMVCTCRILQRVWRWLWDEKNNVLKDHRLYLLYLLKTLLFASDEEEISDKYQTVCSDNVGLLYPLYLQQVTSIWEERSLWSVCFHKLIQLQGAGNYYESAARVLKDKLFDRTRMFSADQLLDYIVTRLDLYYCTKIVNVLDNHVDHILHSHFSNVIPPLIEQGIIQVAGNYFAVPSESAPEIRYTVDAELNTCSCPLGITGVFCIHQFWVFIKAPLDMFQVGFMDLDMKTKLYFVAKGSPYLDEASKPQASVMILPEVIPVENSATSMQSEMDSSANMGNFVTEDILPHSVASVASESNVLISLDNNLELLTPPSFPVQVPCGAFVVTSIPSEPRLEDTVSHATPVAEESSIESNSKSDEAQSIISNFKKELSNSDEVPKHSAMSSAMAKRTSIALRKFEKFCQIVKNGLTTKSEDYLPALEIMMKTLDRKGYTDEHIISGLSYFGVLSVPSLVQKGEKRASTSQPTFFKEVIPRVHGQQMITYGKRRVLSSTAENNVPKTESETATNSQNSSVN